MLIGNNPRVNAHYSTSNCFLLYFKTHLTSLIHTNAAQLQSHRFRYRYSLGIRFSESRASTLCELSLVFTCSCFFHNCKISSKPTLTTQTFTYTATQVYDEIISESPYWVTKTSVFPWT